MSTLANKVECVMSLLIKMEGFHVVISHLYDIMRGECR